MLKKQARLTAREVREVIANGRSTRASVLSAKYMPAKQLRASVVVSKKVAKRAVDRNRVRRAVYRALGKVKAEGTYVVFVQKVPKDPLTPVFFDDLLVLTAQQR
jgi:ribonuclease P protein component